MKQIIALLMVWLLPASFSFAGQSTDLISAHRAQTLLGVDAWSKVIRIENTGSTAQYPRVVHALVFELVGMLWFYTEFDGTQSFSTYRGRLNRDKADFGPLLREINPGFTRWSVTCADPVLADVDNSHLRNGCFVESVANLRRRLFASGAVVRPQLLSYYAKSNRAGHTVLTFETEEGVRVIDPSHPSTLLIFPRELADNAQALGSALIGRLVDRAIGVSVDDFAGRLIARYAVGKKHLRNGDELKCLGSQVRGIYRLRSEPMIPRCGRS
jgi:hypothetical protein